MGSNPIGDAIFLPFFPEIVSNPCKKQILTLANTICPVRLFLFVAIFARQKTELLTCPWVAVATLRLVVGLYPPRRIPICKINSTIFQIPDQTATTERCGSIAAAHLLLLRKNGITHQAWVAVALSSIALRAKEDALRLFQNTKIKHLTLRYFIINKLYFR